MLKRLWYALDMDPTRYSDTTHGRFIQHMDLARAWLRAHGRRTTAQQISRTMNCYTAARLAQLLAERDNHRVCRDCGRSIDAGDCHCAD
jgi:hypothetical protein